MRTDILGVGFDSIPKDAALEYTHELIENGDKGYIVTPNPEIVWLCRQNEQLKAAIAGARLVLPDGVGITIAAKILKKPLPQRIAGIDFAKSLISELADLGGSVFLLGAAPGVAEQAAKSLEERYSGIVISGIADGFFTHDESVIGQINAAKPDLLLVCMGAPKQELWMSNNLEKLDVKVCIGLGGALDVFAGRVKRAPVFLQKYGLEWLYRLICEPRRIKRMYCLPLFVFAVIRQRIRGRID